MESSQSVWWRRHGWTVAILLAAFGMAFALRTIWTYPVGEQFGWLYSYAGGSDSYYHSRVATYIILNHRNLVFDPLLHYPVGAYNPREPLFDWMNAVLGMVFAPLFGGNAVNAGAWFLDFQSPFWAALGVFPVYLIGREVSGKRMGLIAAIIFPFLSANIDSSIFGYANYLSFYTFVILVTVYSYIRTLKAVQSHRWVESYRHPTQYLPALRAFLRTERTAVKWAVFTGVSLGALALAWQGYTYAVVVIGVTLLVAMVVERVRRVDSFGLYTVTWIVGLVGFPMAMPYYIVQHQFAAWFDLPLLLYFGILALLFPFLLMRDVPWIFSIPSLVLIVLAAAGFLFVFEPTYFLNIVTGQGYFSKSLIYSTVAEAQAPSFDQLVVGYGVVTFFLAFVGVAIFVYVLARGKFKRHHIAFLVFAILSIFLPISAAKFFLLGSPAFALLPAEAIVRTLDVGKYPDLRRTVASLSDRRSQAAAFRKAFKPRHVIVMLLVLVLVLPNVWVAIDAGIPGNTKTGASEQVYDTLPGFLKGNRSTGQNYFGAAGSTIDTPNQYDSAGYNWLAQQDTNIPQPNRPALVSWWDYGFQTIDQGQHPSVADNFQNGIDPAGQFLLAQNESNAIAILTTTLLQAEASASGQPYLPAALNTILARDGLNLSRLHPLLANTRTDLALVIAHPERYLPVDPATVTAENAMYMAVSYFLATSTTLNGNAKIYNDVQAYTGWSIRYDLTDSRLIPFSGTNTGIYYAPADLTGRVINSAGLPSTYFNVTVLGSDGNYYPLGGVPADVSAVDYYVNYFAPFYDSMIYRTYFGYNGTDIGLSNGIPGLEGEVGSYPIEPGWMLQHFEVVYKTAYYCPSAAEAISNPECYSAMNQPQALHLANVTGGVANTSAGMYFGGGESMLAYYPGETLLGDLQLPSGAPVSGADVTVFDQWGIPHESVTTASDGSFSLVLPPGNDTLNFTAGTPGGLLQQGSTVLKSVKLTVPNALGYSLRAPTISQVFTLAGGSASGFVYLNIENSTAYVPPSDLLAPGAQVVLWGSSNQTKLTATADASGAFELANVPPGVYNYNVLYGGNNLTQSPLTIQPGSPTNATVGLVPGSVHGAVLDPTGAPVAGALVTLAGPSGTVRTNTSGAGGNYTVAGFVPGNYTLSASVPGTSDRSVGFRVPYSSPVRNLTENLTVLPSAPVSVTVVANGAPAAGVPVQFTPIASYQNLSVAPIADLTSASNSGTSALTGANGRVSLSLPLGAYAVYALGFVNKVAYAGVGTVTSTSTAPGAALAMTLTAALRLSGTIAPVGPVTNTTATAVVAYSAVGSPTFSWAANGSYSLLLPSGSYSVLALEGPKNTTGTVYAALASTALSFPTALNLRPSVAVVARFSVGTTLPNGTLYPASNALVSIAAGSNGPAVTAVASANGTVAAYVPAALPIPATSYCVAAGSTGFSSSSECGISPNGLGVMTKFPLALTPVAVTVRATGLPAGTSATVNLTAASPTALNRTLTSGVSWSTSLPPGTYRVTGWAPTANRSIQYRPGATANETIALGATSATFTIPFVSQTNSSGTLTLPARAVVANATVTLSSASFHATVNGTAYTQTGFFAPVGQYSAYATVGVGGTTYLALTSVHVTGTGGVSPALALTTVGVNVSGKLVNGTGTVLPLTTSVTLAAPGGATALLPVAGGTFSAVLPANTTYAIEANGSELVQGAAGDYYESWTATPGTTCAVGSAAATCPVTMVGTSQLVWLNGTLSAPGVPGAVAGAVRLYGPAADPTVSIVLAANGTFSALVLPGEYSIYASGGGGSEPLAGFASAAASLTTANPIAISLAPSWADTISVAVPTGAGLLGPVNVTVTNAYGLTSFYPGVSPSISFLVALPVGTYTVSALGFGSPYGIAASAGGTTTARIVSGNLGTTVELAYQYTYRATATLVGSSTATVTSPGSASFDYSVRNTGNVPITIGPVGSPSSWAYNFSFSNTTLAPGASLTGSVLVYVPANTAVSHPGAEVDFELTNGTVVGSISPTVRIVPFYGLGVGRPATSAAQVGATSALIPFYVANNGNVGESVMLTVVNTAQLNSRGWTVALRSLSTPLTSPVVSIGAFTNSTYFVNLTTAQSVFIPPGTVVVEGSVLNASGAVQASATLSVPTVQFNPTTANGTAAATVTGPSVGSAPSSLPDWVVPLLSFVPALALVLGVIVYRWWRTRRWTRR
ncbi:MAG: carboxypeptidase regulatory-like domain-containing protein [Thermoplasmata archaeon]